MFKKRVFGILVFLIIGFISLQFIQPDLENPLITGEIEAPAEVKAILERACYSCHSNETNLLWFDRVSPASWIVAQHIKDGRKVLNFSTWSDLTSAQQKDKLWEAVNHAMLGAMPKKEFVLLHPASKLSESDLAILKKYIAGFVQAETYDSTEAQKIFEHYRQWQKKVKSDYLPVAANGVAHDPDYKNWLPIRFNGIVLWTRTVTFILVSSVRWST